MPRSRRKDRSKLPSPAAHSKSATWRPVTDDPQLALDDDRLREVEALVCLALGKLDGARHAGRARRFEAIAAVVLIDQRVRDEDEAAVPLAGRLAGRPDCRDGPPRARPVEASNRAVIT